jgi:hypothetical protein
MKKWILLSLLLVFFATVFLGQPANAAGTTCSGTCGENVTWELDEESGVLTISGSGPMEDYLTTNAAPWFDKDAWCYRNVVTVVIENGVTTVGSNAFSGCYSIQTVVLGQSVTAIGDSAFQSCTWLTQVQLPDNLESIGSYAFSECEQLTQIALPTSVTTIGESAFSFSGLEEIVLPDSATNLGQDIFSFCFNLQTVTLPSGMTRIPMGFLRYCESVTQLEIPETVTAIEDGAFQGTGLVQVELPTGLTFL